MLAVSPLRSTKDENQEKMESSFSIGTSTTCDFADLSSVDGNLLESINFDDLFVGIDVLPDLEMDADMFAEFSVSGGEESEMNSSVENNIKVEEKSTSKKLDHKTACSGQGLGSSSLGEEIVSKRDESMVVNPSPKDGGKGRKSISGQAKNKSQGKRKVKVDWTPELHRRFVQAVEQLGVDKAVPSRILEIMGIDCLTRHNIASHLQKYRSHRKHLLAREAEAASWNQRRQLCGVAGTGGGGGKRQVSPWPAVAPTMCFPPVTPVHHFRPLHVWGHPSMDQSFMPMWPKHLPHSPCLPPPLSWPPAAAPPPPQDPSFWHAQHQRAPSAIIPGAPCFPQPVTTASKESIDAAIGDVLSKPWLPLPLGLKAPALDSVMGELHKQGISNIPPSCA